MGPAPNAAEKKRWNDTYWTTRWPEREALTDTVTEDLLGHVAARHGEVVLDIGSGGGKASLAVSAQVGAEGRVVGADISLALVALARHRAAEAGRTNLTFLEADAQEEAVPGAPFSVAMSQFGVMFFDEPVRAFTNIRRQLSRGGRLAFACWQPMERNPWTLAHAIGGYVAPPATPGPGKESTGPFVLGDAERTTSKLQSAGWSEVTVTPYERTVTVERSAIFDDGQLAYNGVSTGDLPVAREAVARHLAQFARSDGRLDVPVAFFIVTAVTDRESGGG